MFKSTKIKLTAWYLAIIMAVTVTFSSVVYYSVIDYTEQAFQRQRMRVERQFSGMDGMQRGPRAMMLYDQEAIGEIKQNTLLMLLLLNILILAASGGLGYYLSGLTLRPIELMVNKQKRFVSDAAHEIKTPLTAMKTNLQVTLRDHNLTLESAKESLKAAVEEADKMHKLSNHLLKQAKYGTVSSYTQMTNVDVSKTIQNVAKKMNAMAQKKNINIIYESKEISIKGRQDEIEELMITLIDNSIKFSKKNGKIDIHTETDRGKAVIEVRDKGIGIAKEELVNIFEPFYRTDRARTRNDHDGFGLGLSIAKEIVHRHKGSIEVTSKIDKGSTFTVKLPLSK